MKSPRAAAILACVALLTAGARVGAQTSMGAVNGTVTDSSGAVLPGATVTLTSQATNVQAVRVTNDKGYYTFVDVRPGPYTLAIELQGFKTAQVSPFTVNVNESVVRNAALELGNVSESITVTGQSEIVQNTTVALGAVVEQQLIRELPTQGRNFTTFLLYTPGVNPVSTAQGPGANGSNETGFGTEGNSGIPGGQIINASVQGQQNRSKIYYMDGIVNTSVRAGTYVALPDIDSLQEFKVQSHSAQAEFGGVTGGVVNITSKSGANQFNGSGFGFFRNEALTARNPFRDALRPAAPVFRQNQYGGNLGGPIARNRTFFFGSYDGWYYRDVQDLRYTVPTDAELNGDFSNEFSHRAIYNPFTTRIVNGQLVRDQFPGNKIPQELISPSMQAFLKAYMVKPNLPGETSNNFINGRERTSKSNAFNVRIDHHFSASDNLFFRWTERRIDNYQPVGDLGFNTPISTNRNVGGGYFHTFGSNVVMEVRGGVAQQPTEDAPLQHPLGIAPEKDLGLPQLDRLSGYIVGGLSPYSNPNIGVQGPRPRDNPNWNAAADLTWLRGNHSYKGGFQMLQISRLQRNRFGQLSFGTEATYDPQHTSTTGDAVASMLLGLPSSVVGNVPELGFIDFHTSTLSGYMQDQWAMRPNVTLTYGLRYDYITRVQGQGLQSGPDFNTGNWLLALPQLPPVCAGQGPPCLPAPIDQIPFGSHIVATGETSSILKPIKDNWGPRAGVAWQLNPLTVLRTGYGLFWDSMVSRSQYGQHQFEVWGWPQVSGFNTGLINQPGDPMQTLASLGTLPFAQPRSQPWSPTGAFFNDPNRKNAYSHQWNVEIQRELAHNLVLGAGYVGSYNGRMEFAGRAAAPPVPAVDQATGRRLTPAERDRLRPYSYITGDLTYETDRGMARYNALQVRLQHRFANGWASMLSYTFSQTIDTSSGWFDAENGLGGRAQVQNFYDINGARAISSYDIPHIVTWGGLWEIPAGQGKRWLTTGPASWILGNWQLNWNLLARSGQPFTPSVDGDPANLGFNGYARANLTGDPHLSDPTANQWFNKDAFSIPLNSFGNEGRNILRAPAYWTADLGLQRNLPLTGARNLEIKLDMFNLFNHINLGNPETNISRPTAGQITTMSGHPREVQFGFRLTF